jgi:hypothetical protein
MSRPDGLLTLDELAGMYRHARNLRRHVEALVAGQPFDSERSALLDRLVLIEEDAGKLLLDAAEEGRVVA